MKSLSKVLFKIVVFITVLSLVACASPVAPSAVPPGDKEPKTYKTLVVGFAQIGAESGWRDGETNSIKNTAAELGVDLKFSDAQQKQENQIKALRAFIAQKVDVIGIPPVVTTGFETVLQEAKDAGIPVIFIDRKADVPEGLGALGLGWKPWDQ
jgi:simple sugar transport system substrate-binding protein